MEKPPPYNGQNDFSHPASPALPQEMPYQQPPQRMQQYPPQPMYQQPPQPMYQQPPQMMSAPGVPSHTTTAIVMPSGQTVLASGNCPKCRVGFIHEEFSTCGIIWAICCFPLGLICLLGMKDRKCINCQFEML